jgi:hypothetical protein
MRHLIIGSKALFYYTPTRTVKDWDWFGDQEYAIPEGWKGDQFWHDSFDEWIPEGTHRVATLDELYTIKMSHSHWDIPGGSWGKHIADILTMKAMGAKIDEGLYKLLYKVWEEKHGKKVMKLDQDKTEFFDDAVRRTYDHDSLHESVAFGDSPIYEEILRDGASVDIDPRKLWALPHHRIVQLFTEEICVTALERIVIPRNYRVSPGYAYQWALRRTVTSLTKGKSSRFILDHIEEFIKPDPDYVKRHKSKADRLVKL